MGMGYRKIYCMFFRHSNWCQWTTHMCSTWN